MKERMRYKRQDPSRFTCTQSMKGDANEIIGREVGKDFFEYRKNWNRTANFELLADYPLQIDFELNFSCNLRCKMCSYPYENPKGRGGLFDFETYKEIIRDGVKKGMYSVNLNFINEPLLRKDLIHFITFAKEAGVLDIMLNTNGVLLTPEYSEKLLKSGLTRLMISIDATTKETYDQIRIGGDFNKVNSAVKELVEMREMFQMKLPIIRVSFVRMALNQHEEQNFIEYWEDIVDYIAIQEYINTRPDLEETSKIRLNNIQEVNDFRCPMSWQRIAIRYDGTVLPCCTYYGIQLPMGNVKEKTIEEIWKSEKMNQLRNIHKEGKYTDNKICETCALNSVIEKTV
jgi:radical SAM protein with 4Fe4S-binding SPASM domain